MKPSAGTRVFFGPLESLRGLAALVVVVFHSDWTSALRLTPFFRNGPLMVDFFFVLSGFVICHSYGRKLADRTDGYRFMWLRFGRLYPLHLVFLLVFLGIEILKYVVQHRLGMVADKPAFTTNNAGSFLTNLLLIQSLGLHHGLTYNYPSWSISCEFYAYLLFAVWVLIFGNSRRFLIVAGVCVLAAAATLLAVGDSALVDATYGWGYLRCVMGFFIGVLAYQAYQWLAQRPADYGAWRWRLATPLVLAALVVLLSSDLNGIRAYAVPPLGAALILAVVLVPDSPLARLLNTRPLLWLGTVSYSVYMVHAAVEWGLVQVLTVIFRLPVVRMPAIQDSLIPMPGLSGDVMLLVYIAMVLMLSQLTYRWIEAPFRELSKHVAGRWLPVDGPPPPGLGERRRQPRVRRHSRGAPA